MSTSVKRIKIDANKLKHEIKAHNLSMAKLSQLIGYSYSYLHFCCKQGFLPERTAILIENALKIDRSAYIAKQEEPPKEPVADAKDLIDFDRLYKCIYDATYQAVSWALYTHRNQNEKN